MVIININQIKNILNLYFIEDISDIIMKTYLQNIHISFLYQIHAFYKMWNTRTT